jgi:anaerobic selenocysteine-containing dehydrogenase
MRLKKRTTIPKLTPVDPQLLVVHYIATRKGDTERGPKIWLSPDDARIRLLVDGELAWVRGQRGQQLATVEIDETVAQYTCVLRDIVGVSAAEYVHVDKPDLDSPPRTLA